MRSVSELLDKLHIVGHDLPLYEEALTHSSYNATAKTKHRDYERLEFLGDSLIGFVTSELCFCYHPEMQQGELSQLKSQFIRTESEASLAMELDLASYIRVGNSFAADIKGSTRILEDVFESFIGAIILDQGKEFAYKFVRDLFEKPIAEGRVLAGVNPKSELQEAIQAEFKESVNYKLLRDFGSQNEKRYLVGAYFAGLELGRGQGRSKKEAETEAAKDAMAKNAMRTLLAKKNGKR